MSIYYRFRHAIQWEKPVPITGGSITVADLERAIIAAKLSSLGKNKKGRRRLAEARFVVYSAETGEEYGGDNEDIPANTSVIIHLVTLWSKAYLESKRALHLKTQLSSYTIERECIQDTTVRARRPFKSVWHYLKTPPGYVCHRCHIPVHYNQACPTNGDPSYDINVSKHPTVVSHAVCEKDAASLTRSASSIRFPKELNCPLCKEAMKEAMLMRCCFRSFCEKCIRDRITLRSVCACGVTNVSADDLISNKTLRETIKRFVSSTSCSSDKDRSWCLQAQGTGSDRDLETGIPLHPAAEFAPRDALTDKSVAVSGVTVAGPCSMTSFSIPPTTKRELIIGCGVDGEPDGGEDSGRTKQLMVDPNGWSTGCGSAKRAKFSSLIRGSRNTNIALH